MTMRRIQVLEPLGRDLGDLPTSVNQKHAKPEHISDFRNVVDIRRAERDLREARALGDQADAASARLAGRLQ
jgi:hypothetical protein